MEEEAVPAREEQKKIGKGKGIAGEVKLGVFSLGRNKINVHG